MAKKQLRSIPMEHRRDTTKERERSPLLKVADDRYVSVIETWDIWFEIGDITYVEEFLIIREGSDTILGAEFLQRVNAHYHFKTKTVTIDGIAHKLKQGHRA